MSLPKKKEKPKSLIDGVGVDLKFADAVGAIVHPIEKNYGDIMGTAFVIDLKGWLVTAAHVVFDYETNKLSDGKLVFCPSYNLGAGKAIKEDKKITTNEGRLLAINRAYVDIKANCHGIQQVFVFQGFTKLPFSEWVNKPELKEYNKQAKINWDWLRKTLHSRFDISLLKIDVSTKQLKVKPYNIIPFNRKQKSKGVLVGYPEVKNKEQWDRWDVDNSRMVKFVKKMLFNDFTEYITNILLPIRVEPLESAQQQYDIENRKFLLKQWSIFKSYQVFEGIFPGGASGSPLIFESDLEKGLISGVGSERIKHKMHTFTGVAAFDSKIITAIQRILMKITKSKGDDGDYALIEIGASHIVAMKQYINYYDDASLSSSSSLSSPLNIFHDHPNDIYYDSYTQSSMNIIFVFCLLLIFVLTCCTSIIGTICGFLSAKYLKKSLKLKNDTDIHSSIV